MNLLLTILLFSVFTILFAVYSKWQFSDDRGDSQGKWHGWGALMRGSVCISPMITTFFPLQWQNWLLATIIQFPLWDVAINVIALINVKPFYPGSTSQTDGYLKAKKWLLYGIALISAIFIKVFIEFTNEDFIDFINLIS